MPAPNPEALHFLRTRRSRPAKTLVGPAPDRDTLDVILEAGLRVPDHGKLEPWTLQVLSGAAPERLAALTRERGAAAGMDPDKLEKSVRIFAEAPLIIAVISTPVRSEKVPQIEQDLSAGAVCLSLVNAALAAGWGANWLTGWTAMDAGFVQDAFGLEPPAYVAGYIVIGTETSPPPERPRPDLSSKVRFVET